MYALIAVYDLVVILCIGDLGVHQSCYGVQEVPDGQVCRLLTSAAATTLLNGMFSVVLPSLQSWRWFGALCGLFEDWWCNETYQN
jgi:hypothetical protein